MELSGILFALDLGGIGDELAGGVVKTIVTDVNPIIASVEQIERLREQCQTGVLAEVDGSG